MNNPTKIYQTDKGWREVNPHQNPDKYNGFESYQTMNEFLYNQFEATVHHYRCPELENTKEGDTVEAVLVKQVLNVFDTWEFISDESYQKYLKLNESQVHKHYQLRDAYRLVTPKSETEKGEAPTAEIRSAEEILDKYGFGYLHGTSVIQAMHEYHEQFGDGWISVEDRLPEENQIVDVWSKGVNLRSQFMDGQFERYVDVCNKDRIMALIYPHVTHWKPLNKL